SEAANGLFFRRARNLSTLVVALDIYALPFYLPITVNQTSPHPFENIIMTLNQMSSPFITSRFPPSILKEQTSHFATFNCQKALILNGRLGSYS
ncbi:MAG: hypothetical protein ACXV7F_02020, partial [Methylomonas sp.]